MKPISRPPILLFYLKWKRALPLQRVLKTSHWKKSRKRKAINPKTDDEADTSEILLSPIISREGQEFTLQSSEASPLLLKKRTRAYIDDSESD